MFAHALSGAASFAACLRLFRSYPLALNRSASGGGEPSMLLRHGGFEGTGYYVLAQDQAEHFVLRPWHPGDGDCQRISPAVPVPGISHQVITEGMPVPRDRALLGWVSDRQVTALLSVYHGHPGQSPGMPQIRLLARVGTEPASWPPFTARPLADGRLWEYAERGEITDLDRLLSAAGGIYWVPSQNPARAGQGHGCVVVSQNLTAEEFWVPAGTYMDHWMLREGVPTPPAAHLLTLPGAGALSSR